MQSKATRSGELFLISREPDTRRRLVRKSRNRATVFDLWIQASLRFASSPLRKKGTEDRSLFLSSRFVVAASPAQLG